ncbi:MAG TPA: acyl-CoA dehydrogenase family protein [Phenylobacterium sp.]|uniref:acyl-CoA dehydrogenase family protein n=1 Tax=Phenylobacterium sp. TaxID=1871053 RepID=UPI002B479A2F|nr:acyl-CoA dehydrogenase family protein [Phenylobacterium sp.]HKR90214.1 acyl-CoA dehydrogenase family protein [Phenylobacterium sp.]
MKAPVPPADLAIVLEHLERSPGYTRVRGLRPSFEAATPETVESLLRQAARFADKALAPLNAAMDRCGCALENGRVVSKAAGHKDAWDEFIELGWPRLPHREELGGAGLPLAVTLAVQELFDRGSPAFGMLPVSQRSAARLIDAFGSQEQKEMWLEGLVDGTIGATICVSEASVGSDVSQLRTRAREADGGWRVSGEKMWISFGDHQLSERILHCVLADSGGAGGPAELSVFLVEGGGAQPGAVAVQRLEEKLGLHGSPTCVLRFEEAEATMLGERGRGLSQMFVMITQMRLAVSVGGLAAASASADVALAYAEQRKQGGPPHAPVAIIEHADVQRQIMSMVSNVQVLRGLCFAAANLADIADAETDEAARAAAASQLAWLLPIAKTFGAETGFDTASGAIQVLGGAGYTAEWPVEQILRDCRIHAIFEGTTGIQAHDLVLRRLLRGNSYEAFMTAARAVGPDERFSSCLDLLDGAASHLRSLPPGSAVIGRVAVDFLRLAALAATGWIAVGLLAKPAHSPAAEVLHAAANYWLTDLADRSQLHHARIVGSAPELGGIEAVRRNATLSGA